ncbi:hypothetical protein Q7P37_003739 [Cladosporium fusiforme]
MSGGKRPESSIAQSFAADLDSMFGLSTSDSSMPAAGTTSTFGAGDLSSALQEQKQTLTSKAAELEELEAKLRATEERLAKSRHASPARQANVGAHRLPTTDNNNPQQPTDLGQRPGHPLAQKPNYPPDRPPTQRENTEALMSGMPGYMPPPTPQEYGSGRDEYVVVDKNASGGYGQGQSVR